MNFNQISSNPNVKIGNLIQLDFGNLYSPRGNMVPNQFEVNLIGDEGTAKVFKSYKSIIAVKANGKVILDSVYWAYSNTTLKYLKQFLNTSMTKKEILEKIESGEYLTADLN